MNDCFRHTCFWFYFHPVGNSLVTALVWGLLAIPGLLVVYNVIEPNSKNLLILTYFRNETGFDTPEGENLFLRTEVALYWFLCMGFTRAAVAVWLSSSNYRRNGWSAPAYIWIPLMVIGLVGDLVFAILYFKDPFSSKFTSTENLQRDRNALYMALACIRGIIFWVFDVIGLVSAIILFKRAHAAKQAQRDQQDPSVSYAQMHTGNISDDLLLRRKAFLAQNGKQTQRLQRSKSLPRNRVSAPFPHLVQGRPPLPSPPSSSTQAAKAGPPGARRQTQPDGRSPPAMWVSQQQRKKGLKRSQSLPPRRSSPTESVQSVRTWTEYAPQPAPKRTRKSPKQDIPPPPPLPPSQGPPRSKSDSRARGGAVTKRGPALAPKPPMRKVLYALITGEDFSRKKQSRLSSLPEENSSLDVPDGKELSRSASVTIPKPDYDVRNLKRYASSVVIPKPDYDIHNHSRTEPGGIPNPDYY